MRRIRFARILCPVDLSRQSKRTFEHACAIAREHHAELRLLHVTAPGEELFTAQRDGALHQSVTSRLRRLLKDVVCEDIRTGAAILEGEAAREILRAASKFHADLLVMGGGRRREADGSAVGLGHVARVVAERSLCSVLVVPSSEYDAAVAPFRQIVCATATAPPSPAVVGQALSLAEESQGRLTLIHIEPEPSEDDLHSALASTIPHDALNWCDVRIVVTSGTPALSIAELVDAIGADLIVVGAPRGVSSVAHAVAANATCPVLIARDTPGQTWRLAQSADLEAATA
jgi:nucleotide-binding universal stress UspA family protein